MCCSPFHSALDVNSEGKISEIAGNHLMEDGTERNCIRALQVGMYVWGRWGEQMAQALPGAKNKLGKKE